MTGSIVVMSVQGLGHFQLLLPVIAPLAARGLVVHVLTHVDHRAAVERAGARFFDLFGRYPIDAADATSLPMPVRLVSFAGFYAEQLARDVEALAPSLIIYDMFSVAAPVVARRLGVPYVNVFPNHAPVPARAIAALRDDPRVSISDQCRAAVERLREEHGWRDASPFSYVDALSPFLNLYPEPEEFLDAEDRGALEPLAYFGCLAPELRAAASADPIPTRPHRRRIFVSFGTVIWRYYAAEAEAALRALARAFSALDVDAYVALGGHEPSPPTRAALTEANVTVASFADQWTALATADAFVTHHGVNSTHEAIFHRVPMLSYPFFGDQPALAEKCRELGLAAPLVDQPRAPIEADAVLSALARIDHERDVILERLGEARSWELRTIEARGTVIDRLLALAAFT